MAESGCFVGRCGMAKASNLLLNQRVEFCERTRRRQISGESFESICAAYGISRATGYEWLRRLRQTGLEGLAARPRARRRPCVSAALRRWETPLLALRARRPSWGADKLLAALEREHPHARLPSRSAVTRLLSRLGLAAVRKARARRGPTLPRADHIKVEKANDLWTVDFKGWFRTGNGQRCEPLTVRDLFSRFILCIEAVGPCSEAVVGQRMRKLFARYGLPRAIRVDNGAPFGSPTTGSALGLTRLSVWWLRLGIAVEFTRPGCPQDNGAHEQMHRVLKAETAQPPAKSLAAQSRRMEVWREDYNHQRPHAALGHGVPAAHYHPEIRPYRGLEALCYASGWAVRVVSGKGTVKWAGVVRNIGKAFVGERIGLCQLTPPPGEPPKAWAIYLGVHFLGELHACDRGGMRSAQRPSRKPTRPEVNQTTTKVTLQPASVPRQTARQRPPGR